jgi:hypothetical protein
MSVDTCKTRGVTVLLHCRYIGWRGADVYTDVYVLSARKRLQCRSIIKV